MISLTIDQSCPASNSYRAARVRSLFNATTEAGARFTCTAALPLDEQDWQIGLVVGPSGSGKSSIGRRAWEGAAFHEGFAWGPEPIIDAIAPERDFNDVSAALSAVGLGSVPSWLRPFSVLSTGEKFRAELARLLLADMPRLVVDEFTSVVDRQIARIGAHAFVKSWRRQKGRQVILLSCHRDIVEWICPDWILDTEDMSFQRGRLQCRPDIPLSIYETNWRPWSFFEPHHYLKLPHMIGATNYVATHKGEPVAHVAVATNTGLASARMCRLVVMPEWQGAGVGLRFIEHVAERWLTGKNRYGIRVTTLFHTSHPGLAIALRRSPRWLYSGGRVMGESGIKSFATLKAAPAHRGRSKYAGHMRAVQGFRYVGES